MAARTLVLVRHAKAEQYAASDVERDLTERGRADAADLGRRLAEQGVRPDAAYVSAAVRTRTTWAVLADAAGWSTEAVFDRSLYSTDEQGVLELVNATDEGVDTVVVVGHNPTIGTLAQLLDDGAGSPEVTAQLVGGYPTAAATVFEVPTSWSELAEMTARVVDFHVGRA